MKALVAVDVRGPAAGCQWGWSRKEEALNRFANVETALAALERGESVVVLDPREPEKGAALVLAAETATPESVAFMVRHTSGIVSVGLPGSRLDTLELPLMVPGTPRIPLAVSVDTRQGTTTGISASDRATTIRALADPRTRPLDLSRPGHVFPIRTTKGGTLVREAHAEAAVDLARLAGRAPAAALCELVNGDGSLADGGEADRFARRHGLALVSIADLVAYRLRTEALLQQVAAARIPTPHGEYQAVAYRSSFDDAEHVAMVKGEVTGREEILVRVQSQCLLGEAFGSLACDCGPSLNRALAMIAGEGRGVVVYLRGHEGEGTGLGHELESARVRNAGRNTSDIRADAGCHEYGLAAQVLAALDVRSIRLLTDDPRTARGLKAAGAVVRNQIPLIPPPGWGARGRPASGDSNAVRVHGTLGVWGDEGSPKVALGGGTR